MTVQIMTAARAQSLPLHQLVSRWMSAKSRQRVFTYRQRPDAMPGQRVMRRGLPVHAEI